MKTPRAAQRRAEIAEGHTRPGQATKTLFDISAALRRARKAVTDPVSNQKSKDDWKTILGWAVGIGVVPLAVFAGVSPPDSGMHGSGTPK